VVLLRQLWTVVAQQLAVRPAALAALVDAPGPARRRHGLLPSRTLVSIIADPHKADADEVIKGLVQGLEKLRRHLPRANRQSYPMRRTDGYDQLVIGDLFTELKPGFGGALR
jgi:hypothetical protein